MKANRNARSRALHRRRWPALVVGALVLAGAAGGAWLSEPRYHAAATLLIADHTLPPGLDASAAAGYASERVQSLHVRALAVAEPELARDLRDGATARVTQATAVFDGDGSPGTVEIAFELSAVARDPRRAERLAQSLVDLYHEQHEQMGAVASAAPPQLDAARTETALANDAVGHARAELDAFLAANGVLAAEGRDAALAGLEQARPELEQRVAATEDRRLELDRAVRDMQREATQSRAESGDALTSEALVAAQTEWTIARARNGAAAAALGDRVREMQARAERMLAGATAELAPARAELSRVEALHPIDHPDVVRNAHRVSALETRLEATRVTGLTNGEVAYIEGIAQERRDIDGELERMRAELSAVQAHIAERQALVQQLPALLEQRMALEQRLGEADSRLDRAAERLATLEREWSAVAAQRPGEIGTSSPPVARREMATDPWVILGGGALTALLAALSVVVVLERLDRRVEGAALVRRIQGGLPLAEIPFIEITPRPRSAGPVVASGG
jgi:hypothetical protein